jgi:signal recognition particle GTPase
VPEDGPGPRVEIVDFTALAPKRMLRRIEAIFASMTPWERSHPDRLDRSRQRRIVRGSGTSMGLVGKVLTQFNEMRRMMNGPRGSGPSVA